MIGLAKVDNPFPGLRPFKTEEYHLFFGREGQADQLLARLRRTRFLAVVGTSGSGKSSLIRAGLLPALYGGLLAGAGSSWRVAMFRPGNDPVGALAHALNVEVFGRGGPAAAIHDALVETTLRRSSLGLVEAVREARLAEHEGVLIVADQFEELFRFRGVGREGATEDDASAFVKLLLEAARQHAVPVYVVLTMRSDFLGDCAQFQGLPEAINDGQYLIPRMTHDERRAAVTGPAAVGGGEVSLPLINRLLIDMGDNSDQLPIFQHALMRTWGHWSARGRGPEPVSLSDYEAVGAMGGALSAHAEEAFGELSPRLKHVAERVFKALTEKGPDNREIRRPTRVSELCAIAEAGEDELASVAEVFRREGRSFLMPPPPAPLTPDTVIDISHESLIRNWERLKGWVAQESESARIFRRLSDAAVFGDPLTGSSLETALEWRARHRPNAAWAERYRVAFGLQFGFPEVNSFIDDSKARHDALLKAEADRLAEEEERRREALAQAHALAEAESQRAEAESRRAQAESQRAELVTRSARKFRLLTVGLALALILALAMVAYAFQQKAEATRQKAEATTALEKVRQAEKKLTDINESLQDQYSLLKEANSKLKVANSTAEKNAAEALAAQLKAETEKQRADRQALAAAAHAERERRAKEDARTKQAEAERLRDDSDKRQAAGQMYRDASALVKRGSHAAAQKKFGEAAQKFEEGGDLSGTAASYFEIGEINILGEWAEEKYVAAGVHYDKAADYYRRAGDEDGEASVYYARAEFLIKQPLLLFQPKQLADAIALMKRALGLYRKRGNRERQIRVLLTLFMTLDAFDRPQAVAYLKQTLPLYEAAGELGEVGNYSLVIAELYSSTGDTGNARTYFTNAADAYRKAKDHRSQADALIKVAHTYRDSTPEFASHLGRAVKVFEPLTDAEGEVEVLERVAEALTRVGSSAPDYEETRLATAVRHKERAAKQYEALGQFKKQADALAWVGEQLRIQARTEAWKARQVEYYTRALAVYRRLGDREPQAAMLNRAGSYHNLRGEWALAVGFYEELAAVSAPENRLEAFETVGRLREKLNQLPAAAEAYRRAFAAAREQTNPSRPADVLLSLGEVQLKLRQPAQAADAFDQAAQIYDRLNDAPPHNTFLTPRVSALLKLGEAQEAAGRLQEALGAYKTALRLNAEASSDGFDELQGKINANIERLTGLLERR